MSDVVSDAVGTNSYVVSLAQILLDRIEEVPKNARKKAATCCLGHSNYEHACITLHVMKQPRLVKAITRRAHVLIRRSRDVGLDGVLTDTIQDVISLCQAHTCLNAEVVRVVSLLSHIALRLAENNALDDYENYGRMYFFFHETMDGLENLVGRLTSKFISAGNRSDTMTELTEVSTRLQQSVLVWRSKERDIQRSVLTWLRREPIDVDPFNSQLSNIISSYRSGFQKASEQNALILRDLQSLFRRMYGARRLEVKVQLFGSRVSSLGGSDSDLDICISFYCTKPDRSISWVPVIVNNKSFKNAKYVDGALYTKDILYALSRELGKRRSEYNVLEVIPWSRIPIIRFVHLNTGVEIDLCVGNELGVHNTLLLKQYQQTDENVRNTLLMMKYWAKSRSVNNARIGLPSSFSWSLLTLYGMQHSSDQPNCPSFQLTNYATNLIQEYKSNEKASIALYCGDREMFTLGRSYAPSNKSLIETLLAILVFYGTDCDGSFQFLQESVDLLNGARSKQRQSDCMSESEDEADDQVRAQADDGNGDENDAAEDPQPKGKGDKSVRAKQWRMQIVDPFDKGDLGRVIRSVDHQQFFMSEIRRALCCIIQRGSLEMAFEASTCSDLLCSKCHRVGHIAAVCPEQDGAMNPNATKKKTAGREVTPAPKGHGSQLQAPNSVQEAQHPGDQQHAAHQPAPPLPAQPTTHHLQRLNPIKQQQQMPTSLEMNGTQLLPPPPGLHKIRSDTLGEPTPTNNYSGVIMEPNVVAVTPGRRRESKEGRNKRSHSNSEFKVGDNGKAPKADAPKGAAPNDPTVPPPRISPANNQPINKKVKSAPVMAPLSHSPSLTGTGAATQLVNTPSDLSTNDVSAPPPRLIAPSTMNTSAHSSQSDAAATLRKSDKKPNVPQKSSRSKHEGNHTAPQKGNKQTAFNTSKPAIVSRQVVLSDSPAPHPPIPPVMAAPSTDISQHVPQAVLPNPPAPPSPPRRKGGGGGNPTGSNPPKDASGPEQGHHEGKRRHRGRGGRGVGRTGGGGGGGNRSAGSI